MKNIRLRATCAAFAAAVFAVNAAGCASVDELEHRLDQLESSLASNTVTEGTVTEYITDAVTENDPPETTGIQTTGTVQTLDYTREDILEPYVFAVAFTYYGYEQLPPITSPEYIWEALGWWGAYYYLIDGKYEFTDDEIAAAQRVMTGLADYIECPEELISDGHFTHDGGIWTFPTPYQYIEFYYGDGGDFDFSVRFDDNTATGTVIETDADESYISSTVVTIAEGGDIGWYFTDYAIGREMFEPTSDPSMYTVGDVFPQGDVEIMLTQNNIGFILSNLSEGKVLKESYNGGDFNYTKYYYLPKDGTIAVCYESQNSYYYKGVFYGYDDDKGRWTCSGSGFDTPAMADLDEENSIVARLNYGEYVVGAEDDGTVSVMAGYSNDDGFENIYLTLDKGTLRIMSFDTMWVMYGDEEDIQYESSTSYDIVDVSELPEEFLKSLEAFDGDMKNVSVTYIYNDIEDTQTYSVPSDWEFHSYDAPENEYADRDFTEHFEYPGDGKDYAIYVNNQ